MALSRSRVLSSFKKLLRTREKVFVGDDVALNYVRTKIKDEFLRHRSVANPVEITQLLQVANESEELLRTKVIQAEETKPNVFRIRKEHLLEKCVNARERCADCTCGM